MTKTKLYDKKIWHLIAAAKGLHNKINYLVFKDQEGNYYLGIEEHRDDLILYKTQLLANSIDYD